MYELLKRAGDLVAAGLGLFILSPLMLVIVVWIKLSSPGPVLYRGVRTGRHGHPFHMLKFRTMVEGAEQLGGTTTGANDARLTSVGLKLRRFKLDELPQLINVLRGDMSLVGPRPEVYEYTDAYGEEERDILTVRPGITDFASLEFIDLQGRVGDDPDVVYRSEVLPVKNALRLKYVRERSLLVDLGILLRTIASVCGLSRKDDQGPRRGN